MQNLIYSNPQSQDIGIMEDFDFDLAYGKDENDFELTVSILNHCCGYDYFVYIIDIQNGEENATEYGGIIDSIAVDTNRQTVTYKGRTWHGIMAGKVIVPDEGNDYKVVSGNANEILGQLISECDLDINFFANTDPSPITIFNYRFERYIDLYTGIRNMLAASGGKLKVEYLGHQVKLSAVWLADYSQDAEWDSSQVTFKAEKNSTRTNHLICLGSGDLKDRYRIDLFADANGGIRPYATATNPMQDSDYILDDRNKRITWGFEVIEVLDYPNASTKENYLVLTEQPDDWADGYTGYYYLDENSDFKSIEISEDNEYTVTASQPADWTTNYSSYFTSGHKPVEGTETETYTALTQKPSDWEYNYYRYYIENGGVYEAVDYVESTNYVLQTGEPLDWQTAYGSYYMRKVVTEFVRDKDGNIVYENGLAKTRVTGDGYAVVTLDVLGNIPTWEAGKYFTLVTTGGAPPFDDGVTKYKITKTVTAPTWEANKYYTLTTKGKIPPFKTGQYYRKVLDHYADLVQSGVKRLQEVADSINNIDINLDLMGDYDIGDIVGARDERTGIEVWQPIVKKIVSIDRNGKRISYKVGQ